MRTLKLVLFLSIIQMLGGYAILLPGQAIADCCQTCPCTWKCTCPGVNNCPWFQCLTDDSPTSDAKVLIHGEKLQVTGSYSSSVVPTVRSHSIDRLITRSISSQCDKDNYAVKFFQNAEEGLKFEPDFLNYDASEDNNVKTVARQTP